MEMKTGSLPNTNIAPEHGWLGEDPFILGPCLFSGAMLVSGGITLCRGLCPVPSMNASQLICNLNPK